LAIVINLETGFIVTVIFENSPFAFPHPMPGNSQISKKQYYGFLLLIPCGSFLEIKHNVIENG